VVAVEALKRVSRASFGWKASAAGPEKKFSHASLAWSALKNRYLVEILAIMVFLKKNANFMPSLGDVVFEMERMKQAAKDAKRAAAKVSKAAKTASSSSPSSCAGASGGGGADADVAEDVENDETDDEEDLTDFDSSPSLSDGDVVNLLTSIADFRPDVPNAEEESDFLSFLTELERAVSD
jgi:hypothetical protein